MKTLGLSFFLAAFAGNCSLILAQPLSTDSVAIIVERIVDEGMRNSHVMDILATMTDQYGPRLTGSPQFKKAALWAKEKLASFGLSSAHLEGWGPFGRGWTLNRYSANTTSPVAGPLISFPKAWSPGTSGTVTGNALYAHVENDSTLETLKGKLKGKVVLLSEQRSIGPPFEPAASRETDSSLLEMANADFPRPRGRRFFRPNREESLRGYRLMEMAQKEGALALLTTSRGDGGNVFVQGANVPYHPDTARANRKGAYEVGAPQILPQVSVGSEHYNRIVRLLEKGIPVTIELNIDVSFSNVDSGYNVIAEIPGTDLKDEVVMIGAHFDSWQGGTGATDNGAGSATCMEAMRILKTVGVQPRRTIRIGLWSGEEQGLLGSEAYVARHFEMRQSSDEDSSSNKVVLTQEGEHFSVYFNMDNGTGKFRGVYLQGNENVRPLFRKWLEPFRSVGASTLTLSNTGGTDHLSFNRIGLPGFQFIQDEIDYSRTHHSTMDLYDRAIPDDLKQASVIMASFAFNAAMLDEKIPRKPLTN
ncbi:MAG TPA: M20/M25/M40 family metallo-hydrolase [Bacteroidota bacterium]